MAQQVLLGCDRVGDNLFWAGVPVDIFEVIMTKQERRWAKPKVPRRTIKQLTLFAGIASKSQNGNGFHCRLKNQRIDTAVCIVHQTREPNKCFGCGQFKKG
jgi:hypothetical protein